MIEKILINLKSYIAQNTYVFDTNTQVVNAVTVSNKIQGTGLNGEWTIKPHGELNNAFAKTVRDTHEGDDIATRACICITHNFVEGTAETDCYYGEEEINHKLTAVQVNAGIFKTKESAWAKVTDTDTGNAVVVYIASVDNADRSDKRGTGAKQDYWTRWTIGVIYKIKTEDMRTIGCNSADKVFISSVLGVKTKTSSWLKYEKTLGRTTAGKYQVIEYLFSYEDFMELDDTIADRVRGFSKTDYQFTQEG